MFVNGLDISSGKILLNFFNGISSYKRHSLVVLSCEKKFLLNAVRELRSSGFQVVNVGCELSAALKSLKSDKYIEFEAPELFSGIVDNGAVSFPGLPKKILALYNIGILNEPTLGLNALHLLKEFSKNYCVILIWENYVDETKQLCWDIKTNQFSINLSDITPTFIDYNYEI